MWTVSLTLTVRRMFSLLYYPVSLPQVLLIVKRLFGKNFCFLFGKNFCFPARSPDRIPARVEYLMRLLGRIIPHPPQWSPALR